MISFDLICGNDHVFEAWFKDSATFEAQAKAGDVPCPICGDTSVQKSLMAPGVAGLRKGKSDAEQAMTMTAESLPEESLPAEDLAAPSPPPVLSEEASQKVAMFTEAMREVRRQVEENCDYVGDKFPEEARKIHYGETEARPIYGEATKEEAEELEDEGVEVQSIPWVRRNDA